jgi:hypothetical protein
MCGQYRWRRGPVRRLNARIALFMSEQAERSAQERNVR